MQRKRKPAPDATTPAPGTSGDLDRIARGIVLAVLARRYPEPMLERLLRRETGVLAEGVVADAVWRRNIGYLEQRNLVEEYEDNIAGTSLPGWALTADGQAMCEGSIAADPGIELWEMR